MTTRRLKKRSLRLLLGGSCAIALGLGAPGAVGANYLVTDDDAFDGGGGVIRVDRTTGVRSGVSSNTSPAGPPTFVDPIEIFREPGGTVVVTDDSAFGGSGGVIRVNPATGARTTVSQNTAPAGAPTFIDPRGVVVAPNGDILVADASAFTDFGGGVIRVDPATGVRTTVSSNLSAGAPAFVNPHGIAVEANGSILVTDPTAAAVIRVDPATGTRSLLSSNASPSGGPSFVNPRGVGVAANGDVLVADADAFGGGGGVIRVNPATGARTAVSENANPSGGPSFVSPFGLGLDVNGDILVADPSAFTNNDGGVIRVNPATGARSTVSENAAPTGNPLFEDPFDVAVEPGTVSPPTPTPPAPPPGGTTPQCSDLIDNDADGATDAQDAGCLSGRNDAYNPADRNEGDEGLRELTLCGRRAISLVRADARGRAVVLSGLVASRFAGQKVEIHVSGTRGARRLTSVRSNADGEFRARVKSPSRRLFNKVRYHATADGNRSVKLKLPQSLESTSIRRRGASIEIRGKVKRSVLGKRNQVVIRRLTCGRYQRVGQARPNRRGAYVVRFAAPQAADAALYRAETRVLARPGSRRYVRQFARAISIRVGNQSG